MFRLFETHLGGPDSTFPTRKEAHVKRRLLLLVSMLTLLGAAIYAPANTTVTRADDVCACLCTNPDGTLDKGCYRTCIHDPSHPPTCRKH